MLKQLHIQNVAVIHKADVDLEQGLNIFTGETGAGKTILLSAIDAVLGERTSKDMIRTGEEKAQVAALFENISPKAVCALEELGYSDDEGNVLITREIHASGKTSCRINGMPATVSILKAVASLLIHIHGQRDSMQLLAAEQHLHLIDTFGGTGELLGRYGEAYQDMCGIKEELQSLQMDEAQKAQRIDMLTFQVEEIEGARLEDPEEEEALQAQRKLIRNSEQVRDALTTAYTVLRGGEEMQGLDTLMDALNSSAGQAAQFIPQMGPIAQRSTEMGYELSEFAQDIRNILDEFEFDPQELDSIESRLDLIYRLKRKYGSSIEEILAFYKAAQKELESISTSEQRAERLAAQLQEKTDQAIKLAGQLSKLRRQAAKKFLEQVEQELIFLDMPSVKLSVQQREKPLGPLGIDEIELYIVTNVGEVPKPLSKIASGGEVSRIMLAIKNVLAEKDDIATLVFDEVDSGVSGRAAQKIGKKLQQVSHSRQVICVTHLAQVAAFADNHLYISKEVEKGRTFTRISVLDEAGIVGELARITSGDLLTDAALESAREMRALSKSGRDK